MKNCEKAAKAASVARMRARMFFGGAAEQVVKSHSKWQEEQTLSREARALLPPPPPIGVGVQLLPHGGGIVPIKKAFRASARTLQAAVPYGRLHFTQPPLSVSVDANGGRARPTLVISLGHFLAVTNVTHCFRARVSQASRSPSASPSSCTRTPPPS